MLKVEQGKRAVWEHAKEAGMGDDITLIAKYFDIQDISIIYNGKMTFIDDRPRKSVRVPAVPTPAFFKGSATEALKALRVKR